MRGAALLLGAALLAALLAAGPASAMRAHDYLDEQRGPVTLQSDHVTPSISVEQPLDTAAVLRPGSDEQLHAQPANAAAPTPASPVPEPSGWIMLVCGVLMLSLIPHKRSEALYVPSFTSTLPH